MANLEELLHIMHLKDYVKIIPPEIKKSDLEKMSEEELNALLLKVRSFYNNVLSLKDEVRGQFSFIKSFIEIKEEERIQKEGYEVKFIDGKIINVSKRIVDEILEMTELIANKLKATSSDIEVNWISFTDKEITVEIDATMVNGSKTKLVYQR
ncbi:MAG: hypothetical protein HUJ68_12485 [Clostridia bacterium]|nr:hypothetical protein [Clostridia bacterium]